ncbi:glycosyltransferase [Plebeiibacterium sediminum]|uniref:Glycosyltransferase n=1 Tax=Plebeiibacterium sediminum TaxID=2992112 RepID=A0AAE3M9A5_9BACT|nr:glycosyltransferase [Plebeiobacterium sediminum]MCW3789200.1 glycosyltransferase [Plebeiobacterium sediminum]
MPKLLVICPTFPPVNTPDHHRVRISIPWFIKWGWEVTVLAVEPVYTEAPIDAVLEQFGEFCRTIRVKALPASATRKVGLGNLGYRAWWQLKKAGTELIKQHNFDLIYFSTTVFPTMTLGRIWKKKFDIPFILDMQDPWRNDFYLNKPKHDQPPKYKIAHFLDSRLEKWTVPYADGIIAVSWAYPDKLNHRYNTNIPSAVIPFASSKADFDIVEKLKIKNPIFQRKNGRIHVVYTGAVTPGMPIPLELMFKAFMSIINSTNLDIHLYFVGSSYAPEATSIAIPIAQKVGIEKYVTEMPARVGFFEAIKVMLDADFIILPGSMDAGYTASKIYPYILSEKSIIALTHEKSSVSTILKGCNTGPVITFNNKEQLLAKQNELESAIKTLIRNKEFKANTNWDFYKEYSDETMASRQIDFFNQIIKLQ